MPAPEDSRALHWKKAWGKERENEQEEEIFPGSGLACILLRKLVEQMKIHI